MVLLLKQLNSCFPINICAVYFVWPGLCQKILLEGRIETSGKNKEETSLAPKILFLMCAQIAFCPRNHMNTVKNVFIDFKLSHTRQGHESIFKENFTSISQVMYGRTFSLQKWSRKFLLTDNSMTLEGNAW